MKLHIDKKSFLLFGALAFFLWSILSIKKPNQALATSVPTQEARYSLFATSTLGTKYVGAGAVSSSVIFAKGLPNVALAGSYLSHSSSSIAYLLLERSIDNGVTYQSYMTITPESTDVLVNLNGTSTTNGSPFVLQGATSGTAVTWGLDLTMVADYIRLSAKETTTGLAGSLSANVQLTTN